MATTKKTTKKAVRKTKSVPVDAIVLKDNILWAVVERKFLTSQVHSVYTTQEEASFWQDHLDTNSGLSFNKYVVQRVELYDKA